MTALPVLGYIAASERTGGEQKEALEDLRSVVAELAGGSAEAELTIDGGAVTPTVGTHRIDTQADAATDDLDTINVANMPDGRLLLIRPQDNGRAVVVRNAQGGIGQILTADGANFSMLTTKMSLLVRRNGNSWEEVGRFFGERLDLMRAFFALREKLAAVRTYFVRTDGNDANSGLVDNAGGAFLTVQKAVDVAASLDNGGFNITIQVRDGTYTGAVNLKNFIGSGSIVIQGNTVTPANVVISTTSADAFNVQNILGLYVIKALKIQTTTSGDGVRVNGNYTKVHLDNVVFGACASAHVRCLLGGNAAFLSSYAVSGSAANHFSAEDGGMIYSVGLTVTYSNTPAFSLADWNAQRSGIIRGDGMTFTNGATVTGKRYNVTTNAVIETNGGGANYVPGNVAGTTATGGQYV